MPRYDFKCNKCDESFELSLTLKEREEKSPKKKCPKCNSMEVEQMITFGGGVLKSGLSKSCDVSSSCPSAGGCSGKCPY